MAELAPIVVPAAPAAAPAPNPNETWRGFSKRASIGACKLRAGDLRRLYQIINARQLEVGERMVGALIQNVGELAEAFRQRQMNVRNAFTTNVQITGANGDVVSGHGENIFNEAVMPERITAIRYDTASSPKALLQYTPQDYATVHLDFSRPPLLNLGAWPSSPTPNDSGWFVSSVTEAWFTTISARLQEFFHERAAKIDWLHGSVTYDTLLVLVGWPLSLWGAYRLGNWITAVKTLSAVVSGGVYVYTFLLSANLFRALFSYSRWMFPKVELESENSPPLRHRALWYAIIVAVVGGVVVEVVKVLW